MKETNKWSIFRKIFSESLLQAITNGKAFLFSLIASIASVDIFLALLEKNAPLSDLADSIALLSKEWPKTMLISAIALSLFSLFAKGSLLFAVHASLEKKARSLRQILATTITRFPRYVAFELAVIVSLSLIFLILTIPGVLSQENPSLSQNLSLLGILVFLPILITGILIEQFGSFYLLFSRVSIRSSFDLGATLFMKNISDTLLFGSLFLLMFIGFNTALSMAIHILGPLSLQNKAGFLIGLSIFYLCQSLFLTFSRSAWLGFFRFIAKDRIKEVALQTEESMIEKNVPEFEENGTNA